VIIAAFTRLSPARRAARRLLAAGPVVGGCWGLVLAGGHAWTWPVPVAGRVLFGAALLSVIGLLAAAAFGREYRSVRRAGAAGCLGMTAVDTAMLLAVTLTMPALIWPVILAAAASAARLTFIARTLRPVLTS
jgi:hypothetical protein